MGGIAAGALAVEGAHKLESWENKEEQKFAHEVAAAAGLGGGAGGGYYGGGYGGGYSQPTVVEYVDTGPGYYGATTYVDNTVVDNNVIVEK